MAETGKITIKVRADTSPAHKALDELQEATERLQVALRTSVREARLLGAIAKAVARQGDIERRLDDIEARLP